MLPEVSDFCRLYLFRHPALAPDHDGVAIGAGAARLSRRGQHAVLDWLRLLENVELAAVFCSEQPQCADPAAVICAAKGLEPRLDERLRDQHLGAWEGRAWEEIARDDPEPVRAFFAEFGEVVAPGGESLGEAIDRFLTWWGDVRQELLGKSAVVVASGGMIAGFAAAMLGMRLSRAVCLQLPPSGLGILDVFANGVRVASWNPQALAAASS